MKYKRTTSGELIALIRREKDLSQIELADLLSTAQSVISNYERGEKIPNGRFIHHLSVVLELRDDIADRLLQACIFDMTEEFINEYLIAKRKAKI